jgi:hypothetical protein
MNGGQGLVVIGVLYHDQPDPARAFAAQMQASAWPDGMKIESQWLALDCVKLRDAPEQGELTPHVASLAVKPAVWPPQTRVGDSEEVSRRRGYFAVTKPTIASTRPSASAWLSSA